ncbi:hypothetical protein U9M48_039218 [Paspalum notatum var. saurae]|uniref:Reverse transcriptase Ty1/copia-type domain-containing protein n=1 Tax=Paspalum notatum var. saurae TaxID=547442 RepID=A0AAQ3XCH0_PASNO
MDVKTAFFNGGLNENVFMAQPKGFVVQGKENMGCHLKKFIYGLKQASRQWYLKFDETIQKFGFKENDEDNCIYAKFRNKRHIENVLKRYGMQVYNAGPVPIAKGDEFENFQCPKNQYEKDHMKSVPYVSAIESIMYAQVCTRPDLTFTTEMLGRYQLNTGRAHWIAVKKALRYLQGTKDLMLTYRKTDALQLVSYADADWARCKDTKKSTSRYVFALAGGPYHGKSYKQSIVA